MTNRSKFVGSPSRLILAAIVATAFIPPPPAMAIDLYRHLNPRLRELLGKKDPADDPANANKSYYSVFEKHVVAPSQSLASLGKDPQRNMTLGGGVAITHYGGYDSNGSPYDLSTVGDLCNNINNGEVFGFATCTISDTGVYDAAGPYLLRVTMRVPAGQQLQWGTIILGDSPSPAPWFDGTYSGYYE